VDIFFKSEFIFHEEVCVGTKKDKTKRSLSGLCTSVRDKNYLCSLVKFVAKETCPPEP